MAQDRAPREWALRYTQSQSDVRAQTSAPIHPIRSSQGMRLELGLTAFRPGFLVASPPFGVLLLGAKHLFVAAIGGGSTGQQALGVSTFQSRRYGRAPPRRWSCAGHDGDVAMTAVLTTLSVLFALVFTAMLVTAAIRDAPRSGDDERRASSSVLFWKIAPVCRIADGCGGP